MLPYSSLVRLQRVKIGKMLEKPDTEQGYDRCQRLLSDWQLNVTLPMDEIQDIVVLLIFSKWPILFLPNTDMGCRFFLKKY